MKKYFLILLIIFSFISFQTLAQTGCPGCVSQIDPNMAEDTAFLSQAATGYVGKPYDSDVSFRFPKTTTPVFAIDSTTPPNLDISAYEITGLSNLPPGLSWEADTTEFETAERTDGCAKICGIPTEPGQYFVKVELTAFIFGIGNSTSFEFPITVYPEPNDDIPIEIFGNNGCGPTTISFYNNIQSNGLPGFSYIWDFGNLTISQEEFPDPVTYNDPGIYPIFFRAEVDTSGFLLSRVTVTSAECDDFSLPPFVSGKPDLYLQIENSTGDILLTTGVKENANFPAAFDVNIPLSVENYRLKVFDDDGLLAGADDFCGEVSVNETSVGPLFDSTILQVGISVFHSIEVIDFMDTVIINEAAPIPEISPEIIQLTCRDTLELASSISNNIEWFYEGNSYSNEELIKPDEPGKYWVTFTDPSSGCTGTSDTSEIPELVLPVVPLFQNDANWLTISDSLLLPSDFTLEWYFNSDSLIDVSVLTVCAQSSGIYSAILTDNTTGCISTFEEDVTIDPDGFKCLSGTNEFDNSNSWVHVFPNPANDVINIEFKHITAKTGKAFIYDVSGRNIAEHDISENMKVISIDHYSSGFLIVQIVTDEFSVSKKIYKK